MFDLKFYPPLLFTTYRDTFNAGQWNAYLNYFDGVVNLTYSGGTPYNDPDHTPRKSAIVFKCDPEAGEGTPKFVEEAASNHSYLFEWSTRYACPGAPMECALVDSNTKEEYDLSKYSTFVYFTSTCTCLLVSKTGSHLNLFDDQF